MTHVEVVGADTLARTMRASARDLDHLDAVDAAAARVIASTARTRAPRRTGALAASVTANGPTVTAGVRYAAYVHNGARGRPARPFITQATKSTEPGWMRLYEAAVARELAQIKGA